MLYRVDIIICNLHEAKDNETLIELILTQYCNRWCLSHQFAVCFSSILANWMIEFCINRVRCQNVTFLLFQFNMIFPYQS